MLLLEELSFAEEAEDADDVVAVWPVDFPVISDSEEVEDERLTTLKPRRSREESFEKLSVALPAEWPLQSELSKRSMLMPCSPRESILKTFPSGLSIFIHSLGPCPFRVWLLLSESCHVTSHAPTEGSRDIAETANGRRVDHFISSWSK